MAPSADDRRFQDGEVFESCAECGEPCGKPAPPAPITTRSAVGPIVGDPRRRRSVLSGLCGGVLCRRDGLEAAVRWLEREVLEVDGNGAGRAAIADEDPGDTGRLGRVCVVRRGWPDGRDLAGLYAVEAVDP